MTAPDSPASGAPTPSRRPSPLRALAALRLEELVFLASALVFVGLWLTGTYRFRLQTWFVSRGTALFFGLCAGWFLLNLARTVRVAEPGRWRTLALRTLGFVRDWLPFIFLMAFYENVLRLIREVNPALHDDVMMRLDSLVFSVHPTLWLDGLVTPARTEWFAFFYLALFAYPIVTGGILYVQGRWTAFRHFLLAFTMVGYIGYAGYLAVPVVGPRYYFEDAYPHHLSGARAKGHAATEETAIGAFEEAAERVSNDRAIAPGHAANCFPSLHTAWAVVFLIFAFRHVRWLFYAALAPTVYLEIATLYLRFHYVVDLAAGAALGIAGSFLVPRLEAAWRRRTGQAEVQLPAFALPDVVRRGLARLGGLARAHWPSVALLVLAVPAYVTCLPTGVNIRHNGADGSELVAAAMIGGVAHPTGYPLYTMLVRLVGSLPGDPIDATHAMSTVFAMVAALFAAAAVRRLLRAWHGEPHLFAVDVPAFATGAALVFMGTFWSQGVITEVYALHAAFTAALLYQAIGLAWSGEGPVSLRRMALFGLTVGLSFSHHLSTLVLGPALLFALLSRRESPLRRSGWAWLVTAGAALVGLLPWLYIPLAASRGGPLNWGDPSTLEGFLWVLSGAQYHFRLRGDLGDMWQRLLERCRLFHDAEPIVTVVAVSAAVIFVWWALSDRRHRRVAWYVAVLALVFATNVAVAARYDIVDLSSYFLPSYVALASLFGLGVAAIARALLGVPRLARAVPYVLWTLLVVALTGIFVDHVKDVDLSGRSRADTKATRVIAKAPPDAILVGHGDGQIFPLWYEYFVRSERRDLVIIDRNLLPHDWYVASIARTWPELRWPDRTSWEDGERNSPARLVAGLARENMFTRPFVPLRRYKELKGLCRQRNGSVLPCKGK